MKRKKQLKTAWILGMAFGIILLPISLVAAFTAFPFGLIILALNIWIIWYALRCRKEYKTYPSNEEPPASTGAHFEPGKQEQKAPDDRSSNEKEIKIPNRVGEYELKYHYPDVPFTVLGNVENAVGGEELTFLTNGDDVDVYLKNRKIGTMQENRKDMVKDFLNREEPIKAVLSAYDGLESAKMFLAFYRLPRYTVLIQKSSPHQTIKLAGTTKKEYQDNIMLCSTGDTVDLEYDAESDRYFAECSGTIGYFPKKLNHDLENGPEVFISKIDFDNDGRYVVFVDAFD